MRLYDDLADWYPLLTPLQDYQEEATEYAAILRNALGPGRRRVLELGAGAGHNAYYLQSELAMTLTDRAPRMLDHARRNVPDAQFFVGDMRDLRLRQTFDAVFIHDALAYLTTLADLRATLDTAAAHLDAGGLILLLPDDTQECVHMDTECHGTDGDGRSLRCMEWSWSDPSQPNVVVSDFVFALRTGHDVPQVVVDRHLTGLFAAADWLATLDAAGFDAERLQRAAPLEDYPMFLGRKRG